MFYCLITYLWSLLLDLAAVSRMTASEKDLAILLMLRQKLAVAGRCAGCGHQRVRWRMKVGSEYAPSERSRELPDSDWTRGLAGVYNESEWWLDTLRVSDQTVSLGLLVG